MAIGDMRRMKRLCYDMRKLAPAESIHIERVGSFVPTKAGDAIVVDIVPKQILVLIYPLGPAWQSSIVWLDAGTSSVFDKVAESDKDALEWAFLALYGSVQEVMRIINEVLANDIDVSEADRRVALTHLLVRRAVYDYILLGPEFYKPITNVP